MKLHEYVDDFMDLVQIVSHEKHIPVSAVERDYYIVMILQNLANSEYAERCVFKGVHHSVNVILIQFKDFPMISI